MLINSGVEGYDFAGPGSIWVDLLPKETWATKWPEVARVCLQAHRQPSKEKMLGQGALGPEPWTHGPWAFALGLGTCVIGLVGPHARNAREARAGEVRGRPRLLAAAASNPRGRLYSTRQPLFHKAAFIQRGCPTSTRTQPPGVFETTNLYQACFRSG